MNDSEANDGDGSTRRPGFAVDVLAKLDEDVGADMVGKIIQLFLAHGPGRMEEALVAQRAGDLDAVASSLHSIKSSAAMLGATALHDQAESIERHARQGETDAVAASIQTLEQTFADALAFLRLRRHRAEP